MEPSETYRQNATTRIHISAAAPTASRDIGRKTPSAVATPLPPRNFIQHENMCPATAPSAAAIIHLAFPCIQLAAIHTAEYPFPASSSSVITPAVFPATRLTFVAPMFPLPDSRTSAPRDIFTIRYPNGIDPRKYATMGIAQAEFIPFLWRK